MCNELLKQTPNFVENVFFAMELWIVEYRWQNIFVTNMVLWWLLWHRTRILQFQIFRSLWMTPELKLKCF